MGKTRRVAVYLQENLPGPVSYPDCRPVVLLQQMGWRVHVVTMRPDQDWEGLRVWVEPSKAAAIRRVALIRPRLLFSEGGAWQLAAVPFSQFSWVRTPSRSPSSAKRLVHYLLLRQADFVSICNPWERSRWRLRPEKLVDLPYPIDLSFWSTPVEREHDFWPHHGMPPPPGPVIASVGQIMRRKRQVELVAWLAPLLQERPDVVLVLAGWVVDQGEVRQIQALISQYHLEKQVLLPGSISPRTELRQLLAWTDVQVLNTTWESQCMALYEALAAGVPTLIPAIPELTSAFPQLPSHRDGEELRRNLRRLLDDQGFGPRLVMESKDRLNWADVSEHDRIFKEVVNRL